MDLGYNLCLQYRNRRHWRTYWQKRASARRRLYRGVNGTINDLGSASAFLMPAAAPLLRSYRVGDHHLHS
jgi:hypothetical protein